MACKPKKNLEEVIPNAPPDGIDLLKKLLQFNPDKRLTAEQALRHPFVARFHNPDEEPSMDYDVIPALDDDVQLSVDEYRVKLYESIIQKKTNIRRQRREIFLQGHRQKQAQAAEQPLHQQQQPLKQVENYTSSAIHAQATQPVHSSPVKPPINKTEGATVAFGRTTKIQHQRSPSANKSMVRRHSLENDSVRPCSTYNLF